MYKKPSIKEAILIEVARFGQLHRFYGRGLIKSEQDVEMSETQYNLCIGKLVAQGKLTIDGNYLVSVKR